MGRITGTLTLAAARQGEAMPREGSAAERKPMGRETVRYLIWRDRKGVPVAYWSPNKALQALGWALQPLRRADGSPMNRAEAIAAAEAINERLDAWRAGGMVEGVAPLKRADTISFHIDRFWKWEGAAALAAPTRAQYRATLTLVEQLIGDRPAAALTRAWAREFIKSFSTPAMQRTHLTGLRRFASYLVDVGIFTAHPFLEAAGTGIEIAGGTSKRIRIWTRAEIELMVAVADAMGHVAIADAIVLALYSGQRQGDIRRMVWPERGARVLVVAQSKLARFGRVVSIPIVDTGLAAFEARLDAMRGRARQRFEDAGKPAPLDLKGLPLLVTPQGRPFLKRRFATMFAEVRERAGKVLAERHARLAAEGRLSNEAPEPQDVVDLGTLTYSDLRDTCVTVLYESGASFEDICSITGHTPGQVSVILNHYLLLTGDRARRAMQRRGQYERGEL